MFTYLIVFMTSSAIGQDCKIEVVELNFNGAVFSPVFYQDRLVVCSNQKDRLFHTVIDDSQHEPIDLYFINPAHPDSINRFDEKFRTNYNDGPITFNQEGNQLIISRNITIDQSLKSLQSESNKIGLFSSVKYYDGWQELVPLSFNDTSFHCTHPSLNETGDILVFSSDMPGGYGGFDLWKSELKDKKWSKPINFGADVNSEFNEVFPTLNGSTIHFSSARKEFGGLDIYKFNLNDPTDLRPLDASINSKYDDFGIISNDNYASGFFSSNRNGEDQIWSFKYDIPAFGPCDSLASNDLCYTLFEENAVELGEEEALIYEWHINGITKRGIEVDYCFPGPGDYEITLDIIDTIINKTYYNQSYYYLSIELPEQPFISAQDTVVLGEFFSLNAEETNLPDISIDSYNWQISDGTFYTGISANHRFSKEGIYEIQLGVIGHVSEMQINECVYRTIYCIDSVGWKDKKEPRTNAIENKDLVKNVVHFYDKPNDSTYLVYTIEIVRTDEKLAEDDAIFELLKPYGDIKFKYLEDNNQYSYLIGEWGSIQEAYPAWNELIKKGFDQAIVRSINVDEIENFHLDKAFVLKNVQFEYNRWNVTDETVAELHRIVEVMLVNLELNLLITAHTDSEGSTEENMELSINRAESVMNYLISAGIEKDRITSDGKGEIQPLESNNTEEGKQKNRRVEFTFIKK